VKIDEDEMQWFGIIARCLAYLCLRNSEYRDAPLLGQAAFLEKLGLS